MLDKLRTVIGAHDNVVERRVSQTTLLAIAATSRDPATPADVGAVLDGFIKEIASGFANTQRKSDEGLWLLSMASTLSDPKRIEAEIGKQSRPRPDIPAGMPIGDTGWFDGLLSN